MVKYDRVWLRAVEHNLVNTPLHLRDKVTKHCSIRLQEQLSIFSKVNCFEYLTRLEPLDNKTN